MTTIINTPPTVPVEDSSAGVLVGIILGALIVIALLVFGTRYYWHGSPSTSQTAPSGATTVNISTPIIPANGSTTGSGY